MEHLSFGDIEKEFEESLGYIRNDITWLCKNNSGLNYTVALLIGCACEALSDGGASPSKEQILAELLPEGDWRSLAKPLFDALRNGLAHSFDTKHLYVDGQEVQIYISWSMKEIIAIGPANGSTGLFIGIQPLAQRLCGKIDAFKGILQNDEAARKRFRAALQRNRTVRCSMETWKKLLAAKR